MTAQNKNKKRGGDISHEAAKSLFDKVTPDMFAPPSADGSNDAEISMLQQELDVARKEAEIAKKKVSNALVSQDDGSWLLFDSVRLTQIGLEVPNDFSTEDRNLLGEILVTLQETTQFWMGDWANLYITDDMSNQERGVIYKNLAVKFGVESETLMNFAAVCRNLAFPLRSGNATFSHHTLVAYLPESLKGREEHFLNAAVENQWSVRQLREEIQKERDKLNPPTQPDTLIDTKHMKKQFNQVTKLFSADVSKFSTKKRDEYRGKLASLRNIINDLENKLEE